MKPDGSIDQPGVWYRWPRQSRDRRKISLKPRPLPCGFGRGRGSTDRSEVSRSNSVALLLSTETKLLTTECSRRRMKSEASMCMLIKSRVQTWIGNRMIKGIQLFFNFISEVETKESVNQKVRKGRGDRLIPGHLRRNSRMVIHSSPVRSATFLVVARSTNTPREESN